MFPAVVGPLVDSGLITNDIRLQPHNPNDAQDAAGPSPSPVGQEAVTPRTDNKAALLTPPSTASPPTELLTHSIDLSDPFPPPPLPSPEAAWLERDVDRQSWDAFVGQLAENRGDGEALAQAVEEWNVGFFAPRGCHITVSALAAAAGAGHQGGPRASATGDKSR